MNGEEIFEKPKKTVISAYLALLAALVAGLVYIFINCEAGLTSEKYGMSTNDLRNEFYWVLFYLITAGIATILIARHLRVSPNVKIVIGAAVMGIALFLSEKHLSASEQLAPIKREFAVAASHCRIVARGELKCGEEVGKILAERDRVLAQMHATMIGEWRVRRPHPDSLEISTGAAYIPTPF